MNAWSKTNRRWGRKTLVTGVAVLAVLGIGGSVALATIPGNGGVISGCHTKKDGELRVTDRDGAHLEPSRAAGPAGRHRPAEAERRPGRSRVPGTEGRHRPRRPGRPRRPAGASGADRPSELRMGGQRLTEIPWFGQATATATATCPAGKTAVSGGFSGFLDKVLSNEPTDDLTGWTATATVGFGGGFVIAHVQSADS